MVTVRGMNKVEIALNTLTQITDRDVINSKEYENAINSLCELKESIEKK